MVLSKLLLSGKNLSSKILSHKQLDEIGPWPADDFKFHFQQAHLDVVRVGQKHGQPIDAHAPPPSGREAVLQGNAEVLVDVLSFVVPSFSVLRKMIADTINSNETEKTMHSA